MVTFPTWRTSGEVAPVVGYQKMPSSGSGCWHRISESGRWCKSRILTSRSGCWRPISGSGRWCISCQEYQDPEADGGPDDKFSLAPTDPVATQMSVGQLQQISRLRRREKLHRLVQRKLRAWTWPGCVRKRGRDYPRRRWQDQMRDKSFQCD